MDNKGIVRKFILENFLFSNDAAVLADDKSLIESGTIDSTGVLELISFVERTFNIVVQDEEMIPDNLDTVEKVLAFVARKRTAASA